MRENDNFFNLSHPYFIKRIKKTIFILLTYAKKPTPKAQNAKEVFMSGQSLYSLSGTVVWDTFQHVFLIFEKLRVPFLTHFSGVKMLCNCVINSYFY